ncbi:major facilitator transporter [Cryobacterium roopkundense]|uniref:Major facilitator transporter n=1 Tax=Cryobacterium roopkundense TaxID=1001240 RepID=A0A099J5C2_9MICO|nr:MFS transporter [Cryobacterium roopkundense]KGJ72618.1 major facilitator transporter [Cryobacterium roopkundense]MBB5639657.1 putative MFS family arabinose efflux permease [Cryobacterium roopkundense]
MSLTASIPIQRADGPDTPSVAAPPFPWVGLIVLGAAVFLSITSEMMPVGLLPEMSASLDVDRSQIGLLVSWFAFTVVVTSTGLAHLTRRFSRHGLVVAVLLIFALSNVLTAIAPTYEFVVASRILGGMAHGIFWSVVGAYAGHLVPKEQIGRAVSITVAGGTLAFIFGVPVATLAGHLLGWRLTFILLAGLMVVGAVLVWRFVPKVTHHAGRQARTSGSAEASAVVVAEPRRDPTTAAVALICAITAITMVGHYTFYTYVTPFLTDGLGVAITDVPMMLFLFGIAGAVGLLLVGTVFGPRPQLGLVVGVAASAVAVTVLALTLLPVSVVSLPVAVVAFMLWGLAFGTLPPLLQTRMLHTASARIRDTASAFYTTAFNAGIGAGALLGALLLDTVGLSVIPWVYVGLLALSLALVLVTDRLSRPHAA